MSRMRASTRLGRFSAPIFSLHAEQAVLGSILRDPRVMDYVSEHLKPADFVGQYHGDLFAIMLDMEQRSSGSCDVVSVAYELERLGRSGDYGGLVFLEGLMAAVPSVAYLENHVAIVHNLGIRRMLMEVASRIRRMAESGIVPDASAMIERARKAIDVIDARLRKTQSTQ